MTFLALLVAFIALILAVTAKSRSDELARRLAALEAETASAGYKNPPAPRPDETIAAAPPQLASEETVALAPAPQPSPAVEATAAATEAAPQAGLEERLGTRWVVWIGGVTLALGGLFLVRFSIEQGLLGPGVRVLLGALFAALLLGAGEWGRRSEQLAGLPALPIANIPAILTAAGTTVAFGTAYASYALYDFLAPGPAFILLGLVALATLAAALLHGPALAGLGVAAGFATPVLVSSSNPDLWALYVYLAIVSAAAFGLARVRLWRWLAVTTLVFALLWTLPCLNCGPSMIAPHVFHAVSGFALAAALVVCGLLFGPQPRPGQIEPVSSGALSTYLLTATLVVLSSGHADVALAAFAVLVIATLAVAWRAESATAAVAAAAVLVALVFLQWAVFTAADFLVVPGGALAGIGPRADSASIGAHFAVAAVFAGAFAAAGFLAQGRSENAAIAVIWSAAATFAPLALLIALYARIAHLDRSISFSIIAVALAAAFVAATELLTRRRHRPGLTISIALFATGALAALALALTFALDKGWLTIALALTCLGTAWISRQRPIPFLRWLAAALATIVALRIGYEPRIAGAELGTTPIFNWLLWGYGVPALSFWGASILLRGRRDDAALRIVEAAAILFTVLLAFMEIRHAINHGDVYAFSYGLTETALQVCVALALAIGLERLRLRSGSIVHDLAAIGLAELAGLATVFGLLTLEWPPFTGIAVGGMVVNTLALAYALPAVLALALSYVAAAGGRPRAYGNSIAGAALVLALAYVSLEVRRFYHGPVLTGATTDSEQYTYSVAWLAFGVMLLAAGLVVASSRARLAAAVIIGLTVLKVFLIDMSVLTGIYRALSFIGLGVVLVAIGLSYQRLLFRRPAAPPDGPS
jgi:uncharacterized membrane protein